ncbi:HNH endonuclease signature motif containing protein [Burkholderia pseudomallei]|uniref:HNH endonuclease signature motif containing protein n=1 Tax=Burkholderia pseudomallei TaxID=28450 RepID=UPI0009B2B761|nr:HNH endonuclease signature motif containing protein [Burkholderia pseudomallei]
MRGDGVLGRCDIGGGTPHTSRRETDYLTRNGILLRTDIHTLFDLNLLAIDTRCRVKVSKVLRYTEYKDYDGKPLKVLPERSEDQPSVTALEQRLREFDAAEEQR